VVNLSQLTSSTRGDARDPGRARPGPLGTQGEGPRDGEIGKALRVVADKFKQVGREKIEAAAAAVRSARRDRKFP